jgi:hypothetical protein
MGQAADLHPRAQLADRGEIGAVGLQKQVGDRGLGARQDGVPADLALGEDMPLLGSPRRASPTSMRCPSMIWSRSTQPRMKPAMSKSPRA